MQTVTMSEAQTHLPELIEAAAKGEPFLVAEAGKPTLQVTVAVAIEPKGPMLRRAGFMAGQIQVPDDFDTMGQAEIEEMFGLTE